MSPGSQRPSALGRRAFLKAAATIGVALVAEPMLSSAAQPQLRSDFTVPSRKTFKIGVVLPESQVYPTLGASLLAGLQLAFAERGNSAGDRPIELLPKMYGERISGATKQARALILDHEVDLLVGVISSAATAPVQDLLQERRVPLIVTNVGANVVRPYGQSPYIFRNSLNHWQANWATGAWAADRIGKTAFIASSFYESGYDTAHMFERGLAHAGGRVVGRYVTHRPRETDIFTPMLAAIKQADPDLVYAAYSGPQALAFMHAYAGADLAGRVPLVGSGFLFDESLLQQHDQAALHGISGSAWVPELDTPENAAFTSAYQAATGRPASPFAVLGYEAARMISAAVDATPGHAHANDQLLDPLRTRQLRGPRGDLVINQQTQSGSTPVYIREVRRHQGLSTNVVIAKLDSIPGLDEEAAAIRGSAKSGWLNAYLAV
jgi:branched-chain amino acid transport system substrate-binding protein